MAALYATLLTLFPSSVVASADTSVSLVTVLVILAIIALIIWIVLHIVRR